MKIAQKVFILVIILSSLRFAQELSWKHLNGPMGGIIGDIVINSKGELIAGVYPFSLGYFGLYKSTDNGDSWNKIETQYFDFPVYSIYITKNDHIWVGTDHIDRIYLSTDNGETWEIKNNGYLTNECWAFGESNDGVLFAGDGQYNKLFRSTNYGDDWELSIELRPYVFATDSNNIVYTGTATGLYSSTDNGLTWKQDDFLNNVAVSSILIDKKNNIYCGTGYYENGDGVYYSSDGGENWTQLGLAGKVVLSLAFDSQKNLYAGTQLDGLFKTTDMGNTWTQHIVGLYNKKIYRLKINKDDDIFVGSEGGGTGWDHYGGGGVFRSTNSGNLFEHVGLPISFIKNIKFWMDNIITATPSGVQKYSYQTKKWVNLGLHNVEAVEVSPSGLILAATKEEGVFKSSDLGSTWSKITIVTDTLIPTFNVLAINDDSILVSTAFWSGARRTTDGGENWELLSIRTSESSRSLFYDNNSLYINGIIDGSTALLKSDDFGLSYDTLFWGFDTEHIINSISIIPNDIIYLASSGTTLSGIMRSTNGGQNWHKILSKQIQPTVFASETGLVITASDSIHISFDFGMSWLNYYFPYLNTVYDFITDINKDANGQLYLATSTEGLFEVDIVTSVEEPINIHPNKFVLYQNYPNPFNPTTVIHYSIPENSFVTLKVYDILGKIVAELVNESKEAGDYKVSFDASELSSGLYIYTLKANGYSLTKKMILTK